MKWWKSSFKDERALHRTVKFSEKTTVILISYEDRKGKWMTLALDSCRFQRRIKVASEIISPVLEKHLQLRSDHAEQDKVQTVQTLDTFSIGKSPLTFSTYLSMYTSVAVTERSNKNIAIKYFFKFMPALIAYCGICYLTNNRSIFDKVYYMCSFVMVVCKKRSLSLSCYFKKSKENIHHTCVLRTQKTISPFPRSYAHIISI